jgi:hypothetical protein
MMRAGGHGVMLGTGLGDAALGNGNHGGSRQAGASVLAGT